ncbi:MAG: radical SAM protein [Thermodesulfobacteriota bacterium]|nr:radical SAM protein [Thermodesulfobacteriota bacterium]
MSEKKPSPIIIPIFIPNQGCQHRCVFCEQERITSQPGQPVNGKQVEKVLNNAINSGGLDSRQKPDVAFYGGTFTKLPFGLMKELLEAVVPFIIQGIFRSIRVSTRPDALDERRLEALKEYGVLTVELGAQSMDNRVLTLSKRGHTAGDTVGAVHTLKELGFRVGIQLMPGLPGDSEEKFRATISQVIDLRPDMVRLYPALVIRGTELARWYGKSRFQPLGLEQAVEICMESCMRLEAEGIPVIRIGLMSSPTLQEKGQILAGPWHPAFGFLVRSSIHQEKIERHLPRPGIASQIRILAPKREVPLVRGYKNIGIRLLEGKTGAIVTGVIPDDSIPAGEIAVEVTP